MPARKDATGTRSSRFLLSRFALILFSVLVLLPTGCFNLRQPRAARASAEPASLPRSVGDGPLDIKAPPPVPTEPISLVKDEQPSSPLKRLAVRAVESERKLGNYMVRIRRRELVDGRSPDEVILMKFRRAPLSVHLKWLGDESRGREILYVQGQHDDKIHFLTGKGDLIGAGQRLTFDPNSPLVRSKSHYPITEAGLGAATVRFAALMEAIERGQPNAGTARYLGLQSRPEFPQPVEAVEQTLPPGLEPFLPRGGTRYYYFDETVGVPTVVVTFDPNKQEVEYYHFDRLQSSINLDDSDFNPKSLWGK